MVDSEIHHCGKNGREKTEGVMLDGIRANETYQKMKGKDKKNRKERNILSCLQFAKQ